MRQELGGLGRRGATAVFVAVALAALLGMVALAVDVGMLMKVRSDAQRAADAAALAGAQDFLNPTTPTLKDSALYHALEYASRNYVGWKYVDTSGVVVTDSGARLVGNTPEAYVQVMPDTQKVRVFIRRGTTATWFGHLLGIDFVPITVKAAAQAVNAGSGKCVKPFAIPDMWNDPNDDINQANRLQDLNPQQGKKSPEGWNFGAEDNYSRYQDPNQADSTRWTGWGSPFRNGMVDDFSDSTYWNDFGRPMVIKMSNPQTSPSPGFFYPWTMPYDSSNAAAYNGQAPNSGAQWYKWNIANCNPVSVAIGTGQPLDTAYLDKPGNMIGPTKQGIDSLIAQDPNACWLPLPDPVPGRPGHAMSGVVGKLVGGTCTNTYAGWQSSPRVMMVPLFDPSQIQSGRTSLTFNNLALIFLEGQDNAHSSVNARFLFFAKSTGPLSPAKGSLIKKLQLVE
jgi:putative Flp pilus-assembly TadE/G-like protein